MRVPRPLLTSSASRVVSLKGSGERAQIEGVYWTVRRWCTFTAMIFVFWLMAGPMALNAATGKALKISGDSKQLSMVVNDTPLEDVLKSLGKKKIIVLKSIPSLPEKVSGSFKGTLTDVLRRLLAEHNFVLLSTSSGPTLSIMRGSSDRNADLHDQEVVDTLPLDPPTRLSPEGESLARKLFGDEAPPLHVSEDMLKAFAHRALRGVKRAPRPLPDLRE